jgi:hypothetical protein
MTEVTLATKPGFSPGASLAVIARGLSRASENHVDAEALKVIAIFCAISLAVTLLFATNGLDLSPGF